MIHDPDLRATAVLLMAYGGPDCLDAVGPFMCDLTGREPGPEMLARIQARYAAIGGKSPLPEIAHGFAAALEAKLAEVDLAVPVVVGFRYAPPKIGEVLEGLYEAGIRAVVGVSLSPFESKSTSTAYSGAVDEALDRLPGMRVVYAPAFATLPEFAALHERSLRSALDSLDAPGDRILTAFTAHSLPVADLETPERYVAGLREVSSTIALEVGFAPGADFSASERLPGIAAFGAPDSARPWVLAYQSKGQRAGDWIGPDIADVMEIAAREGFEGIAVSPIGFATEHMETRYDLDVVETERASRLGLQFARGAAPNSAPELVDAVAASVLRAIEAGD